MISAHTLDVVGGGTGQVVIRCSAAVIVFTIADLGAAVRGVTDGEFTIAAGYFSGAVAVCRRIATDGFGTDCFRQFATRALSAFRHTLVVSLALDLDFTAGVTV